MDILKSNIVVGVGAALAATLLAPALLPVLGGVGRPVAKALIRGGMLFYEKSREAVAVAGEVVEDMIAEIRAEDAARRAAAMAPLGQSPQPQPERPEATATAAPRAPAGNSGGNGVGGPEHGAPRVDNGMAVS